MLTAAQLNILRDDLNETAPGKATAAGQYFVATAPNAIAARTAASASIAAAEGVNTTSYTDLVTPGPAVTVTCGAAALVSVGCRMKVDSATNFAYMAFKVTGASTRGAADIESLHLRPGDNGGGVEPGNNYIGASRTSFVTGLTAGSNVFTAQYRSSGAGINCTFSDRVLFAVPF